MKIIIIGGVAGGMSAATRLRRLMADAEIIVLIRDHLYPLLTVVYPTMSQVKSVIKQHSSFKRQSL